MYFLSVKQHFDAAHRLLNYPGACANLHGHRWEVEVIVKGNNLDGLGMVVDFSSIKSHLDTYLKRLDHALILSENDPLDLDTKTWRYNSNPTAETIAGDIYYYLKYCDIPLHEVRVYESPNCYAAYRKGN